MDQHVTTPAPAGVIVGTDGSDTALRAVAWAATEARLRHSGLHIVHAAPYADSPAGRRHARGIVGRAHTVAHHHEPHLPISTEILLGDPVAALPAAARGAELLVVGMIGERASDVLVGSVASAVAAAAPCPVAVVRGHRWSHAATHPVVLAVGDPDVDGTAINVAFTDAEQHGSGLVVLHVVHGAAGSEEEWQVRLRPWRDRHPGVPVEIRTAHGAVLDTVLDAARGARLVVTGTRRRAALTGAVLGSTSRALVKLSSCPVVVVPRGSADDRRTTRTVAATPVAQPVR